MFFNSTNTRYSASGVSIYDATLHRKFKLPISGFLGSLITNLVPDAGWQTQYGQVKLLKRERERHIGSAILKFVFLTSDFG